MCSCSRCAVCIEFHSLVTWKIKIGKLGRRNLTCIKKKNYKYTIHLTAPAHISKKLSHFFKIKEKGQHTDVSKFSIVNRKIHDCLQKYCDFFK